jgi:hypothetical protein
MAQRYPSGLPQMRCNATNLAWMRLLNGGKEGNHEEGHCR